jgi:hypothetical protein
MSQAGIINTTSGPVPPSVPTSFVTDNGTAIPASNVLNVVTPGSGTQGIITSGSGSTITITLTDKTLSGTATTTGNITANINVNIPVPTNSTTSVRVNIAGYDSTSNLGVGGEMIASVRNVAGTLTVIGIPDRTKNNDAALSDTNWTLIVSGTNALVQVTGTGSGGGSDVINWRAIIDLVSAP